MVLNKIGTVVSANTRCCGNNEGDDIILVGIGKDVTTVDTSLRQHKLNNHNHDIVGIVEAISFDTRTDILMEYEGGGCSFCYEKFELEGKKKNRNPNFFIDTAL
jgi:hypothetical protein